MKINNPLYSLAFLLTFMIACKSETDKESLFTNSEPTIAQLRQDNYDIRNDSSIYNSATIENFDKDGKSIDVYWLNKEKDTTLRFYRKYDENDELIGAIYYEAGDETPSRDTVYYNANGEKVEASLNSDNQITWKSTVTVDEMGNPVLKTYENSKGEYRGLDSLFFDERNREIKGFYKNSKGKRGSIRNYQYLDEDPYGNWTERFMVKEDTIRQKQIRTIKYYD